MRAINRKLVGAAALTLLFGLVTQVQPAIGASVPAAATSSASSSPAIAGPGAAPGSPSRPAGVPSPATTLPAGWARSADLIAGAGTC